MESGVGSIVWVRRRNGSWWPGQILASTSPDATVDWYNLKKSKCVKPFRCGEFDRCIERVESTQCMPLKKREKYARREDAILHALELERQMLKKQEKLDVACRAKRSRCVYLPAESSDSLDYKETLSHVEMLSSLLGEEYPYHNSLAEESGSAFMDDVESDSSETFSNDSKTNSSETEQDKDEEMAIFSETCQDHDDDDDEESTSIDEQDELAISGDMPHLFPREPIACNEAIYKWQFKGKRNNRNLKRSVGASDRKGVLYGVDVVRQRSHLSHKRSGCDLCYYRNDFSDAFDTYQMLGLEDECLTSRAVSKSQIKVHHGVDWDDWPWEDQPPLRGYWDIKGFPPVCGDRYHFDERMRSMLVDVDLKIQASYQKQHVPIVSLTSKLDGKAIIGHSIQIGVLKDGSSDILFSAVDDFGNDGFGFQGSSVNPPAWRTGRRTANFCVRRPHAEADADFSLDEERKLGYKKLNNGSSSHKASLSRKSSLNSHLLLIDNKSLKRGPKKVSLSSSQKTRTLSSLWIEQNLNEKQPLLDKLVKAEACGFITVACIPVKLVFSRLLEEINRSPLKPASNAALLNSAVDRNSYPPCTGHSV
ncbi:putative PWWP domain-containing protein [Lupinus albus]|uniref:Putative PWWP domain-containing protein n=1 Tax=Lupinus albus TaxID=3870 RepID=A0A6A4QH00_LUPAL|nr:putative PWWP domain-containing protein [Lupinus albus]